jgi:hypothetical protein
MIGNSGDYITYDCGNSETTSFARWGIWSLNGSDSVTLKNLNIHGLAVGCVVFSSASNWTIDNVLCRAAGMVGWETDQRGYDEDPSQSGTFIMKDSTIEYVGCAEDLSGNIIANSCVGQANEPCAVGGYGDAMAFYGDAGAWEIDNLTCQYIMSDCYDSVHGNAGASTKIKNSKFIAIVGASIKGQQETIVENSIFVNDCAWPLYQGMLDEHYLLGGECAGKAQMCRALNHIAIQASVGVQHRFIGNTIFTNQDSDITMWGCTGSEKNLYLRNNIFYED